MKVIGFILNIPWTLLGLLFAIVSIPNRVYLHSGVCAIVFNVESFWWSSPIFYLRNARAMTIGHVVLLSPKELEKDFEHELVHVRQGIREPLIHPVLYLAELIINGYKENKYEKEAYSKAGNLYSE